MVEYGPYTTAEREAKVQKNQERVQREEKRLGEADATGKMLRKFRRDEATRGRMKGRKVRGGAGRCQAGCYAFWGWVG